MAPFVEAEWGPEAKAIMTRLKALVDPPGLLNPGVILNADPHAHLAHLKAMPAVEEEVDKCIECGYCEPKCPSRELTLTPRQRIVVRREVARLGLTGEDPDLQAVPAGRLPVHGRGHLRRGRPVRHRLPGVHRHRRPGQAPAPHRPLRPGQRRSP